MDDPDPDVREAAIADALALFGLEMPPLVAPEPIAPEPAPPWVPRPLPLLDRIPSWLVLAVLVAAIVIGSAILQPAPCQPVAGPNWQDCVPIVAPR